MMVRTQISLEPNELQKAKQRAGDLGISLAEFVRQAVRKELDIEPPSNDISVIFGMFSGGEPIPEELHDQLIGEELNKEYERWQREDHLLPEE